MINLLPPPIKEQIAFAKLNAMLLYYVKVAVGVTLVLCGSFVGMQMHLQSRIDSSGTTINDKQAKISTYKDLETKVASINAQLTAIKTVQQNQPKFSQLLADLAAAMPKGASLSNLLLTGDEKKPVHITATTDSYATAATLRDALSTSPRISQVDLNSVSVSTNGFSATITFLFKPGKAK